MIYMHFYNILLTLYYDMTAETFEYAIMKNGREWTIDPFPSISGYILVFSFQYFQWQLPVTFLYQKSSHSRSSASRSRSS